MHFAHFRFLLIDKPTKIRHTGGMNEQNDKERETADAAGVQDTAYKDTAEIRLRVSLEEYARLERAAAAAGCSLAELIGMRLKELP